MTFPRGMMIGAVVMTVIVAASNYLVQFPVNDWVT
ncbi:MAG: VUT family protein, partial [Rhodospirillaceae bacterium]|nr:VUT family protein [Rhodospirillaceae bacterium]